MQISQKAAEPGHIPRKTRDCPRIQPCIATSLLESYVTKLKIHFGPCRSVLTEIGAGCNDLGANMQPLLCLEFLAEDTLLPTPNARVGGRKRLRWDPSVQQSRRSAM